MPLLLMHPIPSKQVLLGFLVVRVEISLLMPLKHSMLRLRVVALSEFCFKVSEEVAVPEVFPLQLIKPLTIPIQQFS